MYRPPNCWYFFFVAVLLSEWVWHRSNSFALTDLNYFYLFSAISDGSDDRVVVCVRIWVFYWFHPPSYYWYFLSEK